VFVHDENVSIAIPAAKQNDREVCETIVHRSEPFDGARIVEILDNVNLTPQRGKVLAGGNTRFAIIRSRPGCDRIPVAFYVRNDNRAARLVKLIATCGALDIDDPQPAITLMMPDED